MLNFQFYQRVKVLYGNGSVEQIGELVTTVGYKKPLIVCDPGIIATGLVDRVAQSLKDCGCEYEIFDQVRPNPPDYVVEAGAEMCQQAGCDCVVGVGGGGSIDAAKAINLMRFNEGPILRFADPSVPMNLSPGLIIIPTTSGTGSEVSDGIVLSDKAALGRYSTPVHERRPKSKYPTLKQKNGANTGVLPEAGNPGRAKASTLF